MTRRSSLGAAALVVAVLGGCPVLDEPVDMARDLEGRTESWPDFPAPPKLGCAGLVACYGDCGTTSTTQAEFDTCSANCGKRAKSGSAAKYDDALACGQLHCLGDVDAGSGKCKLSADGTRLVNSDGSMAANGDPGTPPKECGRCLNDALAALQGDACSSASSPDCMPAQCTSATNACLNDA